MAAPPPTSAAGAAWARAGLRAGVLTLALAVSLVPLPVIADPTPRAAAHDGYGRMVFDWDKQIGYRAEASADSLVVRFDQPIAGDPRRLIAPLARYLTGVVLSPDRTTATFALARPVTVKSFRSGTSVVIDLADGKPPATPAAAATPTPPTASTPAAATPAAATPTTPPGIELMVRGGEHDGFNRLVFDWPKPVGYTVDTAADRITITFERPARVNVISLRAALPPDIGLLETRPAGTGTAVVLSVPPGTTARHFTSGPRVALDLTRPPPSAPAPPPPSAPPAPPPPPAAIPAPAPAPAPTAPPPLATLAPLPKASPAPPVEAPAAPAGKSVSLGFAFERPTGAAVFRRAGWLWAVFDGKAELDVKLLKRTGGDVVQHVEQIQGVKGTAVRMLTQPGFNPSVRKEGQLWVLDIHEQPLAPRAAAAVTVQMDFQDRGRVVIAAAEGAPTMAVRDPEIGDIIQVVTVPAIGLGVRDGRIYPGLEVLASAQGVAAVAAADGVRLDPAKGQVEATMPGGLYLTPPPPSETAASDEMAAEPDLIQATAPLDISKWMRGGPDSFVADRRRLQNRLTLTRPADRNPIRLEIARHYLANGFAQEALGELRLIAAADPTMVETPGFRAVRGAASFLAGRDAEAIADLSNPALKDDPRVQLFLAAATARSQPDPARQALTLRLAPEEIKGWPRSLRMTIGDVAARAVAAAGDGRGANRIIDAMMGPGLSRRDVGTLSYLGGLASMAGKQYEQAISRFRDAEASESRRDRAHAARDRIELMLKLGKMTPLEAIAELEKLRFAWRGDDYEFQLMKRLGELQIAAGRFGEGLRSMHQLAANYPDHPDNPKVMAAMREAFTRLFLEGEADAMPPVTAIGLYDEFQELTPSGAQGDEMIRRLADRLAAVDLLDRAGELLRHQVQFRLEGLEKARVGTRLAFLTLSDRKAGQALEALDQSEVPDIPAELASQRRYMRVQALDDLGRSAEALALIINDQSEDARRLRGEIYWRLKKWPEAATALESTIEPPLGNRPLSPVMARRVLDTATALTLARDERGLARLRRSYGDLMAKTDLREAFDLLTSEPERGIIDYRRIGDKIKQVEEFQTFMGEWKQRVKAEGLSSIK